MSLVGDVTYISGDTADNDLLLAGGLDGSAEIGAVPGVDLTTPTDNGDVGVHFSDLRD